MKILFAIITLSLSWTTAAEAAPRSCESVFAIVDKPLSEKEMRQIAKNRKDAANYFRINLRLPEEDAAAQLDQVMRGELTTVAPVTIRDIARYEPAAAQQAKNKIVDAYTKIAKRTGRTIFEGELATSLGMKLEELQGLIGPDKLFTDFAAVKNAATLKRPEAFDKIVDLSVFTPERAENLKNALVNRSRYIVTTAVARTEVDMDFFRVLLRAAKEMDAEIFVFPSNMMTTGLDPVLLDTPGVHIITNSVLLHPSLAINHIKLIAKMINPLMGLDGIGPRGQSQIVGHPQLRLKTIATIDNDVSPHMLMTTAAITKNRYSGGSYLSERTNALAESRHQMGALIVEKTMGAANFKLPGDPVRSGFFHTRHITYSEKAKGFTDIDKFYSASGVTRAGIEAIIWPDFHVGEMSPAMLQKARYVFKRLRPRFVAIHDLFNGHSISHYERDKLISGAKKYRLGTLNLEGELRSVVAHLNTLTSLDPNVELRIELSNHDLWLTRWLEAGHFLKETHNAALGIELASAMLRDESPLLHALRKFGLRNPERVVFVTELSWKVAGFEAGQHGHMGSNGAKGSLMSMWRATNKSFNGHTHTTERIGDNMSVGTSTGLRQAYNSNGASSWTNSMGTVTEHGEGQLFIMVQNEFWSEKPVTIGQDFFPPGFPDVVPNNDPSEGRQIDQYSRH